MFVIWQVQVGHSPVYTSDKKLGKGGFGTVYLGRKSTCSTRATRDKEGKDAPEVGTAGCLGVANTSNHAPVWGGPGFSS